MIVLDQHCTVSVGIDPEAMHVIPDGSEDPESAVFALDGLSVVWGRSSVWDQPDTSTATVEVVLGEPPWPSWVTTDLLTVGVPLRVAGSVGGAPDPAAWMFVGTITDVAVRFDEGWSVPRATITALDASRQARGERVGDQPFPAEAAPDRLVRLEGLTATGMWATYSTPSVPLSWGITLAWQDVDATAWAELVTDVAVASDAAAWPVWWTDPDTGLQGPGYLLEILGGRPVTLTLHLDPDPPGMVIVGPALDPGAEFRDVSACWAARDGVEWTRSASTMTTRVAVSWVEVVEGAEGPESTEHTVTVVDEPREASLGVQGASVSTHLDTAGQANALAGTVLARSTALAWAVQGIVLDGADPDTGPDGVTFTDLLTMGVREGLPIALRDMPSWSPLAGGRLAGFVEGATARFTGGRWLVEAAYSSAGGSGDAAQWVDLPQDDAWQWQDVAPEVSWIDVAVPVEV